MYIGLTRTLVPLSTHPIVPCRAPVNRGGIGSDGISRPAASPGGVVYEPTPLKLAVKGADAVSADAGGWEFAWTLRFDGAFRSYV